MSGPSSDSPESGSDSVSGHASEYDESEFESESDSESEYSKSSSDSEKPRSRRRRSQSRSRSGVGPNPNSNPNAIARFASSIKAPMWVPTDSVSASYEKDRYIPLNSVLNVMKGAPIPPSVENGKIGHDARRFMQEVVTEFIGFITGEGMSAASEEQAISKGGARIRRPILAGADVSTALGNMAFGDYVPVLDVLLNRFAEPDLHKKRVAENMLRRMGKGKGGRKTKRQADADAEEGGAPSPSPSPAKRRMGGGDGGGSGAGAAPGVTGM